MASASNDPVLAALDDLETALSENIRRNERALSRAQEIRRQRHEGRPYREIVSASSRPLIVELIAENMKALSTAGALLRREMAQALRNEGLTIEAIANLYGVSRQRISELLRRTSLSSVVVLLAENQPF